MAFQLGSGHYLYLAYTGVTAPQQIATLLTAAGAEVDNTKDSIKDMTLVGHDLIKDVTVGGSNNTVDVTTRQTARQGFSASIISTSDSTMQVQFAYEPRDDAGAYTRNDIAVLQYCFTTKTPIFAIDLDKPINAGGVGGGQGVGANWSIGFSVPKEVQGQVVMDVEFALESYAQIVYTTDGLQASFRALVDP